MTRVLIFLIALAASACSGRDLDRQGIERHLRCRLQPGTGAKAAPDAPRPPVRIGIHFEPYHRSMVNNRYVEWSDEEKGRILGVLEGLKGRGIAAEVIPLVDSRMALKPGEADPKILAEAAAKTRAETILVVHGAGDIDERSNPFAALYLIPLLGSIVSPGTTVEAVFAVRGTLLDAGAARAILAAEGEAERRSMGPLLFVSARRVADRAREAAIGSFLADLEAKLAAIAPAP